ncbi:unnamed protein product [Amoebophrya sp. A25]|nr:unnamed protein product [Amoebophrya sp. A25]|eukprot:GSA25T00001522001.1
MDFTSSASVRPPAGGSLGVDPVTGLPINVDSHGNAVEYQPSAKPVPLNRPPNGAVLEALGVFIVFLAVFTYLIYRQREKDGML